MVPAIFDAFADELADAVLDGDVQADRRLVEIEQLGIVEQGHAQVGPHPLAERDLACWQIDELGQAKELGELGQVLLVSPGRDLVHVAGQVERLDDRDVPPQLGPLAEDDADVAGVLLSLLVRDQTVDDQAAGGGNEDAGQHLDGGGLAGAVRPEIGDRFPGLDAEVDVIDGQLVLVLACEEMLQRADQPGLFDGLAELLGQPDRFY